MQKNDWISWLLDHPWMIELGVAIILFFLLNVVLKRILRKERTEHDWRAHLEYAFLRPARILLWILLIFFCVDLASREFGKANYFPYAGSIRNAAIVLCLAWFLLRWRKGFHAIAKSKANVDLFTVDMASKLFTVVIVFLTLLIVMQIFGLNITPLVTFGGIGAAVIGIAGKDTIANLFGGVTIYLTRPFMVNDVIELPQKQIIGNIEEIGWYFTSVRDMQKKPIYIPNSVFTTEPLINQSRMTHRRIEESIGVRYEDLEKIPKIVQAIRSYLENHNWVDHQQSIYVFLESFGDFSVKIELKAYILKTRYQDFMEVRQEILAKVYEIIAQNGAESAYPTMQVVMRSPS